MHYVIRYPRHVHDVIPPGTAFIDYCLLTTRRGRSLIVAQPAMVPLIADQLCHQAMPFECVPIRPFTTLPEAVHGEPRDGLCSYIYYHVIQSAAPYALLQQNGPHLVFVRLVDQELPVSRHQVIVPRETVVIEYIDPSKVIVWPE